MDPEKLKLKALSLFKSFVNDLINVYPEHKQILYDTYGDVIVGESDDITKFLENISKYEKLITNRNEELFSKDIYIFDKLSMDNIWKSDISESTKKNIWKYLQTFCVIHINLKSSESLKELLKGETSTISPENKKDLKDLKKIKKMKDDMKDKNGLDDMNIEDMLNNSTIGKIAKEITESLDLPNMDSPDDISKIFAGDGIMGLFNKVNTTVKEKLESGELNDDILKKEATNMYPNMMNNDLFKSMSETMSKMTEMNVDNQSNGSDSSIKINNNNLV